MRRADAHRGLIRVLMRHYPGLLVLASRSEPWASVTFTGARHILTCARGVDLTGIETAEFPLSGHIVADVSVTYDGEKIVVEALTVETD